MTRHLILLSIGALAAALAIGSTATAGIIILQEPGGGNPAENITFNQAGLAGSTGPGTSIFGATNQTSTVLQISSSSVIAATGGIGQATIQTSPGGGTFGNITFQPGVLAGFNTITSFTDFKFNVNSTFGNVEIKVNGTSFGSFFLDANGQNFFRITASGGDVMTKVEVISQSGNIIQDVKQVRIGGLNGLPPNIPPPVIEPALAPEPASLLAWGFVAAAGVLATRFGRRRSS